MKTMEIQIKDRIFLRNTIGFHGFPYGKLWKTMPKARTKLNESFET